MYRRRSPAELRRAHAEYLTNRALRFIDLAAQFERHPAWLRQQWIDLQLPLPRDRDCGERQCLPSRADILDAWNRYPTEPAGKLAELLGLRSDSLRRMWRELGLVARDRRPAARRGKQAATPPADLRVGREDEHERQWQAAHPGKGGTRRVLSDEAAAALHTHYVTNKHVTVEALAKTAGVKQSTLSARWRRMGLRHLRRRTKPAK